MPALVNFSSYATATPTHPRHRPILAERFKTKCCQNFARYGLCPYEDRCMFAHGDHELRTAEANLADGLTTEESINAFVTRVMVAKCIAKGTPTESATLLQQFNADCSHPQASSILAERFKTKLCSSFERQGTCHYGSNCMFAHDVSELRTTQMNIADNLVTLEAVRALQHGNSSDSHDNTKDAADANADANVATSTRRKSKRRGGRRVQEHCRASAFALQQQQQQQQHAMTVTIGDSPRTVIDHELQSVDSDKGERSLCQLAPVDVSPPSSEYSVQDAPYSVGTGAFDIETPASLYCPTCGCAPLRQGPYQHNPYAPIERLIRPAQTKHGVCQCRGSKSPSTFVRSLWESVESTPTVKPCSTANHNKSASFFYPSCSDGVVSSVDDGECNVSRRAPVPEFSPLAEVMGHQRRRELFGVSQQPLCSH